MEPDGIVWIPEHEVRATQFLYPEIKIFITDTKENVDLKLGSISISGIWDTTCCKQCQYSAQKPFYFLFLCTHVPLVWWPHLPGPLEPFGSQVTDSLGVSTDFLVQGSGSPVPLPGLGQPYGMMCTPVSTCWISARVCPMPGFLCFLSCPVLPNHLHADLHSGSDSKTVPSQWVCKGQSLAEEVQIWELGDEKFLFCPICTGSRENRESHLQGNFTDTSITDVVLSVYVHQDTQCFKTSNS